MFAFKLKDEITNYTVFDVSNSLRERGWLLPAYTFPANRTDLAALRVVVKLGFTHDMADLLVKDIERQLPHLQTQPAPVRDARTRPGSTTEAPDRENARGVTPPAERPRSDRAGRARPVRHPRGLRARRHRA